MPGARIPMTPDSLTVQYFPGSGYAVTKDGEVVSAHYRNKASAASVMAYMRRVENEKRGKRERPCMCCKAVFHSEGPHNRLCSVCRNGSDAMGEPVRPYILRGAA